MARIGARTGQESNEPVGASDGFTGETVVNPRNIVYTEQGSIEPVEGSAETSTVEPARRRGRPVGSKNKSSQGTKAIPLDVNSVTFSLTGIHALLAAGLSSPELIMSESEAKIIASNAAAVMRHYDLQASQKAIDWGNLVVALGAFYGPRFISIGVRKRAEARERRHQNPGVRVASPVPSPPSSAARAANPLERPNGAPLQT